MEKRPGKGGVNTMDAVKNLTDAWRNMPEEKFQELLDKGVLIRSSRPGVYYLFKTVRLEAPRKDELT